MPATIGQDEVSDIHVSGTWGDTEEPDRAFNIDRQYVMVTELRGLYDSEEKKLKFRDQACESLKAQFKKIIRAINGEVTIFGECSNAHIQFDGNIPEKSWAMSNISQVKGSVIDKLLDNND